MATAEELLGTIADVTDEFLVVNLDTRIIAIPASIKILGVESDDDVKRIKFKVPRQYGEFDLSTFSIQVNFENANGEGDCYVIDDLEVMDDGIMTFTWLVDRSAFKRHGEVDFSLCMKKFDDEGVVVKELNTAIAVLPVLKGLETMEAVVENNPSAFDTLLFRLYAVEAATGNSTNGYYTIASVNETDDGVEISIFGSDGISVATLKDGQPGYTPVRGVDYWTEEDLITAKSEVNTYAEACVAAWAPVSSTIKLTAGGWSNNKQSVTVVGVTSDSVIVASPEPSYNNHYTYLSCGVRCVSQTIDKITFECAEVPAMDLNVNIISYYTPELSGSIGGIIRSISIKEV